MKTCVASTILALAALAANPASASAELAKAKNCMACHAIGSKLVGPSFKDIATRYAGNKDAQSGLAGKIRKGSTGVWGAIPMPANANVNDEEAATLAKWILSQN